jgi:hypothetical protein
MTTNQLNSELVNDMSIGPFGCGKKEEARPMKPIRELSVVPTKRGPRKLTITQEDLAEVEILRQEAKAAVASWRQKRREVRLLIENGARVEPGIRFATLTNTKVLVVR